MCDSCKKMKWKNQARGSVNWQCPDCKQWFMCINVPLNLWQRCTEEQNEANVNAYLEDPHDLISLSGY